MVGGQMFHTLVVLWLLVAFKVSLGLPPRGQSSNLYGANDAGISSFEDQEVVHAIVNSTKPWMIQFYSSWCGHCRHFQPIFSEFGARVQGWTDDMMGVGVVNCASDNNMDVCRNYDVMGYPTVKLFPPNSSKDTMGTQHTQRGTATDLTAAMTGWIRGLQAKPEYRAFFVGKPDLTPIQNSADIWAGNSAADAAVVLSENDANSFVISQVILDLHAVTKNRMKKLIVRSALPEVIAKLANKPATAVAVNKQSGQVTVLATEALGTLDNFHTVVIKHYNKLYPESRLASLKFTDNKASSTEQPHKESASDSGVASEAEVDRRRYTVYVSDVEKALEYALTHEIGQRKVIGGRSLTSLKEFLKVLKLYYPPTQASVHGFLIKLDRWVSAHDDAIKGEDFERKINDTKNGVFRHKPDYIGCKGSKANYGGYPCGLWSLWHVLTTNQLATEGNSEVVEDNQEVLMAMVSYVRDFFGCRDCARHFLSMAEDGDAIRRDVTTSDDAVLWLWRSHNRVNLRLSGDISDDPVFPKSVFPSKQHCPECYNEIVAGHNLDVEFHKDKVSEFLVDLYHTRVDFETGMGSKKVQNSKPDKHNFDEEVFEKESENVHTRKDKNEDQQTISKETVDDTNFMLNPESTRRRIGDWRQNRAEVTSTWFFSMADISLCFAIYLGSTLLIIIVCLKFCSKRLVMKVVKLMKISEDNHYEPLKRV